MLINARLVDDIPLTAPAVSPMNAHYSQLCVTMLNNNCDRKTMRWRVEVYEKSPKKRDK